MQSPLVLLLLLLISGCVRVAIAGNPRYVAGASYFNPVVKGQPLTWDSGQVSYFTDQGDLSLLLPHSAADALVADSFSRWTGIPTVALAAIQAGQLAEDVNGSNVTVDSLGNVSVPADIQLTATARPVAVVYDFDGTVTDALLGAGAGLSSNCFTNAAFGGADNFGAGAHFAHALVVVNGNCAQSSSDIPELQYRLVRVLGQVLGLGWSQLNSNVLTGKPQPPSAADRAGFPLMHPLDPLYCVPISRCYPSPDQPREDDRASLSRLYPVTSQNLGSFPSKTIFTDNTARVYGSVYFADDTGIASQPMQGVNVIARFVDPVTNQPSRQYAVSSVSGFLFRGNAGNPVTGFVDAIGNALDRFGSDDTSLEGYFDISGLDIPSGATSGTYEITVEGLDPLWSQDVGPYAPWQVQPSGGASPIRVTVSRGGAVKQDIFLVGGATDVIDTREPDSFNSPLPVPPGGDWTGSLSGYGDSDYFWLGARANRTLSVEVTALDDAGSPTVGKARPVIGMWSLSAPLGSAPAAYTATAFNSSLIGLNRLDVQLFQSGDFRVGIADERGDGRPDYRYSARILYANSVLPARIPVGGTNPMTIDGLGFRPGMNVSVGSANAPVLASTSTQIIGIPPSLPDGQYTLTLSDPLTGGSSIMTDVLTVGAGPGDTLLQVQGANGPTPAGTMAANPFVVAVVASDGITPVAGATVVFSSSPAAHLSACAGASTCTVLSDETGQAATRMTPPLAGAYTMTASLAPASYAPAQSVQTTLSAVASSLDIASVNPRLWLPVGASADIPITAQLVSNGSPLSGGTIVFTVSSGVGTLSNATAVTDSTGSARTTLQVQNLAMQVQVSACVSPGNSPCATERVYAVASTDIQLRAVAGSAQLIPAGQSFQPIVVRATDSSSPPNPLLSATVDFSGIVLRPDSDVYREPVSESGSGTTAMPVILGTWHIAVPTDMNGLASIVPSPGSLTGPVEIEVTATTGTTALQLFELESLDPNISMGSIQPPPGVSQAGPGRTRRERPSRDPHDYRVTEPLRTPE